MWYSLLMLHLLSFITLGFMTLNDSAATVFGWFQDLVSVAALVNWLVVSYRHT